MAKPGPRPEPIEVKRRKGGRLQTGGGTSTRKLPEPLTPGGAERRAPSMPVGKDRRWQNLWKRTVPLLDAAGVLDSVDAMSLEMLIDCLDEYYAAAEQLKRAKYAGTLYLTVGTNGAMTTHPAMKVHTERRQEFMRWSDRFGLDPSARTGLLGGLNRTPPKDVEDLPAKPQPLKAVEGGKA